MGSSSSRYYLIKNMASPERFPVKVIPQMANKLGDLIRERMKSLGIETNVALAEKVGVSSGYIGDLINNTGKSKRGHYIPSPELVSGLSKQLHISQIKILAAVGYEVEHPDDSENTELQELFFQLDAQHKIYLIQIARVLFNESARFGNGKDLLTNDSITQQHKEDDLLINAPIVKNHREMRKVNDLGKANENDERKWKTG